jgi:hypothetical protein
MMATHELIKGSLAQQWDVRIKNADTGAQVSSQGPIQEDITDGTGANQANRLWHVESRSLGDTATENLDLYDLGTFDCGAGAGLDPLGLSWSAEEVVALQVSNSSTSTGSLLVGGEGSAAAWSAPFNNDDDAKILLPPGASVQLLLAAATAYDITDATNHLLKFEATGGALTYTVRLLARET